MLQILGVTMDSGLEKWKKISIEKRESISFENEEEFQNSFMEESYLTWSQWKTKYNKSYTNQDEEEMRKKNWEKSLQEIKEHNAKYYEGEFTYRNYLTSSSDQTLEELWWMDGVDDSSDETSDEEGDTDEGENDGCEGAVDEESDEEEVAGGDVNANYLDSAKHGVRRNEPANSLTPGNAVMLDVHAEKDWRIGNHVTSVKSQGRLPACWIFAAVAAVESHLSIRKARTIELSAQQLVDCCEGGNKKGSLNKALKYIKSNGLTSNVLYPYNAQKRTFCLADGKHRYAKIKDWKRISPHTETELEKVVQYEGPVAVTLTIFHGRQFRRHTNYEDIFYDADWEKVSSPNQSNQRMRHCVLVVGYGSDPNKPTAWVSTTNQMQVSATRNSPKVEETTVTLLD